MKSIFRRICRLELNEKHLAFDGNLFSLPAVPVARQPLLALAAVRCVQECCNQL